ncbi:hypothetical protein SAMN07250955_105153 [Arboricoccus pini]|uniref:Uncharacterized protein n=1 Tax=Arboricoccus pini TaxID=1963835 RepID=A0A212R3Q7_9PROT|nr:hypothetical protein SAMN07250955_105153 [Arboricoccus pini]
MAWPYSTSRLHTNHWLLTANAGIIYLSND